MSKGPPKTPSDRDRRLAEALRDNLRRRKEQMRSRSAMEAPGSSADKSERSRKSAAMEDLTEKSVAGLADQS